MYWYWNWLSSTKTKQKTISVSIYKLSKCIRSNVGLFEVNLSRLSHEIKYQVLIPQKSEIREIRKIRKTLPLWDNQDESENYCSYLTYFISGNRVLLVLVIIILQGCDHYLNCYMHHDNQTLKDCFFMTIIMDCYVTLHGTDEIQPYFYWVSPMHLLH